MPELRPDAHDAVNPDGDRHEEFPQIKFRCQGCGKGVMSVRLPWTPHIAKYRCRYCNYVSEVQTKESVWDAIEGSIEEGRHTERMKTRSTNSRIVTMPGFGRVGLID